MKKIKICFSIIFICLTLFICNAAYANIFFDKGRNYTTYLNGADLDMETCVVSASANVTNNGYTLTGNENIRCWGRLDNINKIYGAGFSNWIQGQVIRLTSDDSRRNVFYINGVNPPPQSYGNLDTVKWDILNYCGIPSNTIQLLSNDLASGIIVSGQNSYDCNVKFTGVNASQTSLPNNVSYSTADSDVNGSYSGVDAYFGWHLEDNNNTSLALLPQAKVEYAIDWVYGWPVYQWTDFAVVPHTVNDANYNLSMISPNGGEELYLDDLDEVTWSYSGNPSSSSTVNIDLYNGGTFQSNITPCTSVTSGSHAFWVSDTQPGNNYSIKITSNDNTNIFCSSANFFSILACPLELIATDYSSGTALLSNTRSFRDNVLSKSQNGKQIISLYSRSSPYIIKKVLKNKELRKSLYNDVLDIQDLLSACVAVSRNENTQYTVGKGDIERLNKLRHLVLPQLPENMQAETEKLWSTLLKEDYTDVPLKNVLINMGLL